MNKRITILTIIGIILVATGLLVATCVGAKSIPLSVVWDSLFHYEDTLDMQLVLNARLPRAIASALVGGILALAGAMMQGVTRNPIAEPSVLGMTQGATLAVAFVSTNASIYGLLGNTMAALIGALLSGGLILLFSMQKASNMSMARLLLAGTAMSTFFISMASVIAMLNNRSQELSFWVAGGFRTAGWNQVKLILLIGGITTILSLFLAHKINIVSLGEEVSIGLGVNPVKIRFLTILLLIPMCAVCVATAGNIAFVGLIIPHIIRKCVGQDYRYVMPLSFLLGSALLVWADIAARMVNIPYETPIGIFTAALGVPIFILLVRKEKN